MFMRRSSWWWSLLVLVAAWLLGPGCVTNGRRVLLKEYGPSVPATFGETLKGTTICLKSFASVSNLVSADPKGLPEEPVPFNFMDFTPEQNKLWDQEMKALQKKTPEADGRQIGNMRNGFGMVMSHVYALNDPAVWLAEGLKFDLEAQGAKVVDASQSASADVCLSGTILLCRADMYFMINGEIVADLEVQPKQGEVRRKQIHTHGSTMAVLASEGEYFHALRECRQKLSILATHEIVQALKPHP